MSSATRPEHESDRSDSGHRSSSEKHRLAVMAAPDDRDAALAVLEQVLGMNAIDAKTRLRHLPAVWPDEFDPQVAKDAAVKLRSLGTQAAAVPSTDVPDLHRARTLHYVKCEQEGFVIMSLAGEPEQTIPWRDVALLSVADVVGLRQESTGGVPDGVFRHASRILETKTDEHGVEMWLICTSPMAAYRIDAELMNYEYLGDRRSTSTEQNFATLVEDLRQHVDSLSLTRSAEAFVNNSPGRCQRMPSPEAHHDSVVAHWVIQHATPEQSAISNEGRAPTGHGYTGHG